MHSDQPEEAGFISLHKFYEASESLHQRYLNLNQAGRVSELHGEGEDRYLTVYRLKNIDETAHSTTDPTLNASTEKTGDYFESAEINDEEDEAAIHHQSVSKKMSFVEYHILYSVSYQVPVLCFFLHNLPPSKLCNIDTVYQYLVPQYLQAGVRDVSVMGGIGMTNHPVTSMPCFWVHPCNTAEAMHVITHRIEKQVSPWEYLVIWVGLVGGVVGLSLPKEIVVEKLASTDDNHVS